MSCSKSSKKALSCVIGRRSRNFTFSEDKFVQEHHYPKQQTGHVEEIVTGIQS
jgi:hypothetical protein